MQVTYTRLRWQGKTAIHPTRDKSMHPSTANLSPSSPAWLLLPCSLLQCTTPNNNLPAALCPQPLQVAASWKQGCPGHSPTATRVPRGQGAPPCTAAQQQPAQRQAARAGGSQLHTHLTSTLPARGQLSQSQGCGKMQCCPCQVCPFNKFTEKNQQFLHP